MPNDIELKTTSPDKQSTCAEKLLNFGLFTCGSALYSGVSAANSAASGATGAALLNSTGFADYDLRQTARAGAAGALVIAMPLAIVLACCRGLFGSRKNKETKHRDAPSQLLLTAGAAAISGALGHAMLYGDDNEGKLTAGESAAATALGSVVISGGLAALGAI